MFPGKPGGFVFDRMSAMAFLKALTGGRDPKNGDSLKFVAEGEGKDLSWVYSRLPTMEQISDEVEIEINWGDILGKPILFPPSPHIHSEVMCVITHGADATMPRVPLGYVVTWWVGMVEPLNAINGDYWVQVNFL